MNRFCCPPTILNFPMRYAVYAFVILILVSIVEEADKWALSTLQVSGLQCASCGVETDPFYKKCVADCIDFSDSSMGFLTGPSLSLTAGLLGVPIGWISDRYSRTRILAVGLFLWSIATGLSGFIMEFWQLAVLRIIVGIGVSVVNPTIYSMVSDYFPPQNRSLILAITSSMVFVGLDLGLFTGFIAVYATWRIAYFILGGAGLILFPIFVCTVYEPARGGTDLDDEFSDEKPESSNLKNDLLFLVKKPAFLMIIFASLVRYCGGYSLGSWMQVFYRRVHGLSPEEITVWLSIIIPLGGCIGSYSGGYMADKWARSDKSGKAWLCVLSSIFGAGFMIPMLIVDNYVISFLFLWLSFCTAEAWLGPALSIMQDIAPGRMRSLTTGVFFAATAAGSIGPFLVGLLTDAMEIPAPFTNENSANIGYDPTVPLLLFVPGVYTISAVLFSVAGTLVPKKTIEQLLPSTSESSDK